MTIKVTLDIVLAQRKMKSKDLANLVGISEANLSLLKQGHVKGIRFQTLNRLCNALQCLPGDIIAFVDDDAEVGETPAPI